MDSTATPVLKKAGAPLQAPAFVHHKRAVISAHARQGRNSHEQPHPGRRMRRSAQQASRDWQAPHTHE